MEQTIMCLDLGGITGYAIGTESGRHINSGSSSMDSKRQESRGMKFRRFRTFLDTVLAKNNLGVVYYEEVKFHAGTMAAHAYGGYQAILQAWCDENEVDFMSVPFGQIKKHATGKGNAKKPAMIEAMENKGHKIEDDNHADALSLFYFIVDPDTQVA